MENRTKKIIIPVIVLSGILFINVTVLLWIYPNFYKGNINTTPFTPPIVTLTLTPHSEPTQTNSPTASPVPLRDLVSECVHSAVYWSNHTENWPAQLMIGNITFSKEEGITVFKAPIKDVYGYLFIQMTAAYLNNINASPSNNVKKTITDAATWLRIHPAVSELIESDRQTGISLGMTLADFNNGKLDPGLCAEDPTDVPFTAFLIMTSTRTPARIPSNTQKPQQTQTKNQPASTATKTNGPIQPTTTSSLKPTDTLAPPPTQTLPPESSPTPIPLPTAALTLTQTVAPVASSTPAPPPAPALSSTLFFPTTLAPSPTP